MDPRLTEDVIGLFERAARESGLQHLVLCDDDGTELAQYGDEAPLPDDAKDLFRPDGLRRIALSLDEEEPEYAPSARDTGGAFVYFARADVYLVGAATLRGSRQVFDEAVDQLVRRVETLFAVNRKDRRKRFRSQRIITRVCDKTYVMSAEVRRLLERLCDLVLELEDNVARHRPTGATAQRFVETLAELVARPKKAGEAFQMNLESLRESTEDLAEEEITDERVRAITAGLELSIESWPLP